MSHFIFTSFKLVYLKFQHRIFSRTKSRQKPGIRRIHTHTLGGSYNAWAVLFCFQSLQDENGFSLPRGPLFMSPLSFTPAVMEALTDPSSTKSTTLRQLIDLFDRKQVQLNLSLMTTVWRSLRLYSGDLNSDLVRYLNGPKQFVCWMVCYSSHVLNSELIVCYSNGKKFGNQIAFGYQTFYHSWQVRTVR